MLRLTIKRVMSNPIDIERYQGEFFNLAKSMKRAEAAGVPAVAGLSNFEQLVELGKAGRTLDANDHHIVHLVDWLWQYAFDQRASDIHLEPRRDVGILRFRIDGVLHEVYQVPVSRAPGDGGAHQDPRAHGRGGEAPAPGRAHQDAHARRGGDRAEALVASHRPRREARDAHLRSRSPDARLQGPGLHPGRARDVAAPHQAAGRHPAGDRSRRARERRRRSTRR